MNIKDLENKIINDDCLNILKQLPDKSVDLVLTDPPYGGKIGKRSPEADSGVSLINTKLKQHELAENGLKNIKKMVV